MKNANFTKPQVVAFNIEKNGKIIALMVECSIVNGKFSFNYYEQVWNDYYGLLYDFYTRENVDKYTGLRYCQWIKTVDYDMYVQLMAETESASLINLVKQLS